MDNLKLIEQIKKHIIPSNEEYGMTSYALKAAFEHILHSYISVQEFEEAMIQAGFSPIKHPDYNHHYFIEVIASLNIPSEYWGHGYTLLN